MEEGWNDSDDYGDISSNECNIEEKFCHSDNSMNEEIFCRDDYHSHDNELEESFCGQEPDQFSPVRDDFSNSHNEDYEWIPERDVAHPSK